MGKQSSRMWFGGFDHKDIYFDGYYHKQMYLGSNLIWEKLNDDYSFAFLVRASTAYGTYCPIYAKGNIKIDYGDGTVKEVNNNELSIIPYTYKNNAEWKTVKIYGDIREIKLMDNSIVQEVLTPMPNTLDSAGFSQTFYRCTRLSKVPENLFENYPNAGFSATFQGCGSSGFPFEVPEKLFTYCAGSSIFASLFDSAYINGLPEKLFAHNPLAKNFSRCFNNTKGMGKISSELFANNPLVENFSWCFYGATLNEVPEGLFRNNTSVKTFEGCFANQTALKIIPESLFDNCDKVENFNKTFYYCGNLESKVPELWNRENVENHEQCFYGCYKASNWSDIPSDWR